VEIVFFIKQIVSLCLSTYVWVEIIFTGACSSSSSCGQVESAATAGALLALATSLALCFSRRLSSLQKSKSIDQPKFFFFFKKRRFNY
jgi:hypothetical protein